MGQAAKGHHDVIEPTNSVSIKLDDVFCLNKSILVQNIRILKHMRSMAMNHGSALQGFFDMTKGKKGN